MSETKHTAGPWYVSHRNADDNTLCIDADSQYAIARVSPKPFYKSSEQEANAHLIAQSPDMLAILQELAETVPMSIQQRTRVDAVIRKATQY